jgi:hypothetical protein
MELTPTTWTIYDPELENRPIVTIEYKAAVPVFDHPERYLVIDQDSHKDSHIQRAFPTLEAATDAANDLADRIVRRRKAEVPFIEADAFVHSWLDPRPY